LLGLIVAASRFKMWSLFPVVRQVFGRARAGPLTVLMNTRLTSATVIRTLLLGLRLITTGWYSIFTSGVVVLALVSSAGVRAFPGFRSVASPRESFGASDGARAAELDGFTAPLPKPLDVPGT
jgi:hypothetical protein